MVRLHALAELPSCVDDMVRWKQREIRRLDTRNVGQARGLRLKGETLDVINDRPLPLSLLGLLDWVPRDVKGLRDRALLSSAYDAGLRRSEVVRMQVTHLEWLPNGEGSLVIPRSKTDQMGEGTRAWLSARSVTHICAWLERANITSGYVFQSLSYRVGAGGHLAEGSVSKILKARLGALLDELVGTGQLTGADRQAIVESSSGHSLRVGCDQDLFAAGVDIGAIMQGLRWSSPKQPLAYARHLAPATSKLASLMRRAEGA